MEDIVMGIGMVLAVAGPILLVVIAWLLYRFVTRPLFARYAGAPHRVVAFAAAAAIVAIIVAATYLPGRLAFDRLCDEHATPTIHERVRVPGYFVAKLHPYEATGILDPGSFTYVEAADPYDDAILFRYSRVDSGEVNKTPISSIESRYGVRKDFDELPWGVTMSRKTIYEIESGRVIATAADLVHSGGPLSMLLGVYGMSSCPDPSTREGAVTFDTFYHLEEIVLGGREIMSFAR